MLLEICGHFFLLSLVADNTGGSVGATKKDAIQYFDSFSGFERSVMFYLFRVRIIYTKYRLRTQLLCVPVLFSLVFPRSGGSFSVSWNSLTRRW